MIWALIVAGGSGTRMRAARKKQYLMLGSRPILGRTLMVFDRHPSVDRLALVVPEADVDYCRRQILAPLDLVHEVILVTGGARRQDSVFNGLSALGSDDGFVMIHDGVRPFVSPALIDACIAGAASTGACIPALAATDTVKEIDSQNVIRDTLKRAAIRLAQTPQTFSIPLIRDAHQMARKASFTANDDASIAEYAGAKVLVVSGDRNNIKITDPLDLLVAQSILDRANG